MNLISVARKYQNLTTTPNHVKLSSLSAL